MTAGFALQVYNERYKGVRRFSVGVLLLNLLLTLLVAYYARQQKLLAGIVVTVFVAGFYYIFNRKQPAGRKIDLVNQGYYFAMANWLFSGYYVAAGVMALLWFLHTRIRRFFIFSFSPDGIAVNSFPKKTRVAWPEIAHAVVKDGLLTINFRNNKVWQHEIYNPVDEHRFSEFVKENVLAHTTK